MVNSTKTANVTVSGTIAQEPHGSFNDVHTATVVVEPPMKKAMLIHMLLPTSSTPFSSVKVGNNERRKDKSTHVTTTSPEILTCTL